MNFGAGKGGRIRETLRLALGTTAFFGPFWTALSMACPNLYIRIFMAPTQQILEMTLAIIRTYAWSFLLLPVNIFSTYYFQAIMRPKMAFIVSEARGLVISGALILGLPALAGADSLWSAIPITELLVVIYAAGAIWGIGINLGNSLDAVGREMAWNNPITTREMIHMYAAAGFDILRVPTTWALHMGLGPDYIVDPAWMNRVQEVVDWALEEGMRVILNVHHENETWLRPELKALKDVMPQFVTLWKQICFRFRDYGDRLIFQGMNEPHSSRDPNAWNGASRDVRAAINALNHAFVATVRESGGKNPARWLCIPPAAAQITKDGLDDLIIPKDPRVIVTVHNYAPSRFVFAHNEPDETPHFDAEAERTLNGAFELLQSFQSRTGATIMMTEHGAVTKIDPETGKRNDSDRAAYETAFLSRAKALGIPCVLWDNNYFDDGDEWFGLFDRTALRCNSPEVLKAMLPFRAAKK